MRFDSHAHLAPGAKALESLLETMRRLEIDAAVVVPGSGVSPAQLARQIAKPPATEAVKNVRYDNLGLLQQCQSANGRLFPFYFANPHDSPDEYRAIGARFRGLKLGPAVHGEPLRSAKTRAYVEIAVNLGHPIYAHSLNCPGFTVLDFVELAKTFPKGQFILGHGGVGHLDLPAVDWIAPLRHIFFETSGTFLAVAQYACEQLGSHRVLFGTEYPLQSSRAEIAKLLDLNIEGFDREQVMGGNIQGLLARGLQ